MASKETVAKKRSGGRKSRMAARNTTNPEKAVVSSGLTGGRYAPLLPSEVEQIIGCALDVLWEVGVGSPPPDVAAEAIKQGASLDDKGRLHLPHKLVEHMISIAAKSFTLHGRDRRHDLLVDSSRVHLGTTGLIVKMVDPITGIHRESTLEDLYDFGRIVDAQEHIHYYIPNEELISQRVENWSYSDRLVRQRIPIGIDYSSDVQKAIELSVAAAEEVPRVLDNPKPVCHLNSFGDNAVNLELRIWIEDPQDGLSNVRSEILLKVWERFHEEGIDFPFPQRDLHVRSSVPLTVRVDKDQE